MSDDFQSDPFATNSKPRVRPARKTKKKSSRFGTLWAMLALVFGLGALGVAVAALGVIWHYSRDLPSYDELERYTPAVVTRFYAADGSIIGEYARERRVFVPYELIPRHVVDAFLSAEDKNFFEHAGIDLLGIVRAAYNSVRSPGRLQGASTITQQVAKNFLLSSERTIDRKVKEIIISLQLEQVLDKEQILELYMNEIYLGLNSFGVASAAFNYFDKSVQDLSIQEAAYLAALPKAPSNYHPFRKTEAALGRRNWVLGRLVEDNKLDAQRAEAYKKQPLGVVDSLRRGTGPEAGYFAEEVRRKIVNDPLFGSDALYEGGLSVRTTLDPKLQEYARQALMNGLAQFDRGKGWRGPLTQIDISGDWAMPLSEVDGYNDLDPWRFAVVLETDPIKATIGLQARKFRSGLSDERETGIISFKSMSWAGPYGLDGRQGAPASIGEVLSPGDVIYVTRDPSTEGKYYLRQIPEVNGSIVVMDPFTGHVKALVGGLSFEQSEFNRATQAKRQPGSAFKPFVYAAALENGYTPSSVILDAPIEIAQENKNEVWRPENYLGKSYGPSTIRVGVERSRNTMTVRLASDVGMPRVAEVGERFGIYDNLLPYLSASLGAFETTVIRLTNAYAVLANGGRQLSYTLIDRIQDRYGRTIFRHDERTCRGCKQISWRIQDEPEIIDKRGYVMDPYTVYQTTGILEGVVQRGTGRRLRDLQHPIAAKTGTSNDEKDAWMMSYTPDLVVGVFVGYDQPAPMGKGNTGGRVAGPIVKEFYQQALKGKPARPFQIPPGLKLVRVDPATGVKARPGEKSIVEAFKPWQDAPVEWLGLVDTTNAGTDVKIGQGTGGLY